MSTSRTPTVPAAAPLAAADLPWLASLRAARAAALQGDRLPHAILLGGLPGLGQALLAEELVAAALCLAPDSAGLACGQCRSCVLHRQHTHEDFHRLAPEADKSSIGIELVRELGTRLALSPQRAPRQVALVQLAEQLTLAANNALLKTLEEPPGRALLVLVSNQPRALLPTIRSRCAQWLIAPPAAADAVAWLQQRAGIDAASAAWRLALHHGAPLAALQDGNGAADLALVEALAQVWRGAEPAAELVRRERQRSDDLGRVLLAVLELSVKPARPAMPAAVEAVLGLTARIDSSSLCRVAREAWQGRLWSGSGVREDLQLLATLGHISKELASGA